MKKYVTLLLSLSGFLAARAQLQQPKLSPVTRSFLAAVQKQAATNTPPEGFLYKKRNDGQVCISALIKLRDAASATAVASELKAINATTGTKAGLIWTVQVPVSQVSAFVKIAGIAYIQADEPVFPDLYEARKTTRVDSVHKGIALPMPYTGKGVISGIMDFGFDYNHPTLYDTSGHRYRVRKVWEMGTTGTAPAGYSYGHELTDTNLIRAQLTDNDNQTHGAGVAGLAAGSGGGIPADSFRGIAFESDMVFVGVRRDSLSKQWLTGGFSDFVDGVKYIFDAADAAGKPAVANISWGSQSGPHDGTSPINQAFDAMSGKGKVIVMSAGNDGNYGIHLNKTFTLTDTSISTGLTFSNKAYKRTWIDIWGDTAKTFCVTTTLYHGGVAGNSTGSVCIDGNIHDYTLIAANGLDTCYVQVITNPSEYNDKPRVTVNIYNKASDTVAIRVSGTDGSIDMWNEYYYYGYTYGFVSTFSNLGMPGFVTGNVQTTVSDMGAAKSTLLVGAYSTRPPLGAGTAGTLSSFSSRGPMIDGRIKPDITAPGLYVATSYNSEDTAYSYTGSAAGSMVRKCTVGGKDYYYGEFAGTSASAPIASGIVALLMEVDPTLTPERVKDLLFSTAITDIKTGTLPPEGNNNWGHGKINAYGAVRKLVKELSVYSPAAQQLDCALYPNPGNGRCILDINTDHSEALTISVTGITGNVILERSWKVNSGNNQYPLDISGLAAGMYLVKISGQGGSATLKAVLR